MSDDPASTAPAGTPNPTGNGQGDTAGDPFAAVFTRKSAPPRIGRVDLPPPTGAKFGYARVSKASQSLHLQIDALRREGCTRIWEEKVTGSRIDRPALKELCSHLRPGDVLVVWWLDRLGRSLHDLLNMVAALHTAGVHFQSVSDGIRTDSATGMLVLQIFGAIAELERSTLIERTHAGLDAARDRGRVGGRKPVITAHNAPDVLHYHGRGLTNTEVAAKTGISVRSISRFLSAHRTADETGDTGFYHKYGLPVE